MNTFFSKNFCLVVLNLLFSQHAFSQIQASTSIEKKNFLIEKGTGHTCGSCPTINLRCDSVVDSHPGKGMLIEYHFGPDPYPQASPLDQDFTTPYGDTIYEPTMLNWPFYLNMMVNRRDQGLPYGSTFIFGVNDNQVQREADAVINQNAEVNLALSSSFNWSTRLLTIYVDAYYTASSATTLNFLQIALTEDSIVGMQYDVSFFNPNYYHMNTFRDNINGFGGDTIWTTVAGTHLTRTYTYTIPTFYKNIACDPEHCYLTAYVAEEKALSGQQSFTGKIINSLRSKIGTDAISEVNSTDLNLKLVSYPNPSYGILNLLNTDGSNEQFVITDLLGKSVREGHCTAGKTEINLSELPSGTYFAKTFSSTTLKSCKVVLIN